MYKTEYFTLSELAHPKIIDYFVSLYGKIKGEDLVWRRLDADVLQDLDYIREEWYFICRSGVYCNRLDLGLDSRGLRPPNDEDGSFYSTHKNGGTFDLEPVNGKDREFFNFIKGLIKDEKLKAINTLEDFGCTLGWTHAGKTNTEKRPLIIFP